MLTARCPLCKTPIPFAPNLEGTEATCEKCDHTFFLSPLQPDPPAKPLPVARRLAEPPPLPGSKPYRPPTRGPRRPSEPDYSPGLTPEGKFWFSLSLAVGAICLLYAAERANVNPRSPFYGQFNWLNFWTYLAIGVGIIIGLLWRIARALEKK